MFSLFQRKPQPPSIRVRKQLERRMQSFSLQMDRVHQTLQETDPPITPETLDPNTETLVAEWLRNRQIRFETAYSETQKAQQWISECNLIWPEGKDIFSEFLSGIDCMLRFIRNYQEITTIQLGTDPIGSANLIAAKKLFQQNREYSSSADKHLEKGCIMLRDYAGIDIMNES